MSRPSWEIRVRDPRRERWQRILIFLLVLAVPAAWFASQWVEQQNSGPLQTQAAAAIAREQQMAEALELLRRRLAIVESGEQLTQQVSEQGRQSIKLLESEIYQLQQELGTCKAVVASKRRDELQLRAFEVVPSADPQRFFFKLFLSRTGDGSKDMQGRLLVTVAGKQDGKRVVLGLSGLSKDVSEGGLPFSLRNFLAFPEGGRLAELRLPQGFSPSEIRVKASVDGQKQALEKTFKWQAE